MAAMQRATEHVERADQAPARRSLESARDRIALGGLTGARAMYESGFSALRYLSPSRSEVLAP